jgi:hypothetical protein
MLRTVREAIGTAIEMTDSARRPIAMPLLTKMVRSPSETCSA